MKFVLCAPVCNELFTDKKANLHMTILTTDDHDHKIKQLKQLCMKITTPILIVLAEEKINFGRKHVVNACGVTLCDENVKSILNEMSLLFNRDPPNYHITTRNEKTYEELTLLLQNGIALTSIVFKQLGKDKPEFTFYLT